MPNPYKPKNTSLFDLEENLFQNIKDPIQSVSVETSTIDNAPQEVQDNYLKGAVTPKVVEKETETIDTANQVPIDSAVVPKMKNTENSYDLRNTPLDTLKPKEKKEEVVTPNLLVGGGINSQAVNLLFNNLDETPLEANARNRKDRENLEKIEYNYRSNLEKNFFEPMEMTDEKEKAIYQQKANSGEMTRLDFVRILNKKQAKDEIRSVMEKAKKDKEFYNQSKNLPFSKEMEKVGGAFNPMMRTPNVFQDGKEDELGKFVVRKALRNLQEKRENRTNEQFQYEFDYGSAFHSFDTMEKEYQDVFSSIKDNPSIQGKKETYITRDEKGRPFKSEYNFSKYLDRAITKKLQDQRHRISLLAKYEANGSRGDFFSNTHSQIIERGSKGSFWSNLITLGNLDALEQDAVNKLVSHVNEGKELTKQEEKALEVLAFTNAIELETQKRMTVGYNAGNVTMDSAPFMLEMVLYEIATGGLASTTIANKVSQGGLKILEGAKILNGAGKVTKFGKRFAELTTKAVAKLSGGAVDAAVQTALLDGYKISVDTDSRMLGKPMAQGTDGKYSKDYEMTIPQDTDLTTAQIKAFTTMFIENFSERAGGVLEGVGKVGRRAIGKRLPKMKAPYLSKIDDFFKEIAKTKAYRGVNVVREKAELQGVFGETAEEIIGGTLNALLVGDENLSEVWEIDNIANTFVSMIPTQLAFGAVGVSGGAINLGTYKIKEKSVIRKLNKLGLDGNSIRREIERVLLDEKATGEDVSSLFDTLMRDIHQKARVLSNKYGKGWERDKSLRDKEEVKEGLSAIGKLKLAQYIYTHKCSEELQEQFREQVKEEERTLAEQEEVTELPPLDDNATIEDLTDRGKNSGVATTLDREDRVVFNDGKESKKGTITNKTDDYVSVEFDDGSYQVIELDDDRISLFDESSIPAPIIDNSKFEDEDKKEPQEVKELPPLDDNATIEDLTDREENKSPEETYNYNFPTYQEGDKVSVQTENGVVEGTVKGSEKWGMLIVLDNGKSIVTGQDDLNVTKIEGTPVSTEQTEDNSLDNQGENGKFVEENQEDNERTEVSEPISQGINGEKSEVSHSLNESGVQEQSGNSPQTTSSDHEDTTNVSESGRFISKAKGNKAKALELVDREIEKQKKLSRSKKKSKKSIARAKRRVAELEKVREEISLYREDVTPQETKEEETIVVDETKDSQYTSPREDRARGFRLVLGHRTNRQGKVQGVRGARTNVRFADGVTQEGYYMVIEADDLQPSHLNGNENKSHFLPEAQPKNRTSSVSVVSSQRIAGNINPQEITHTATAYQGSPNVNERGEVIQGNNRGASLKLMYAYGREYSDRYRNYLLANAESFGLDRTQVAEMKHPVLVNVLPVNDQKAIELGQYTQTDTESANKNVPIDERTFSRLSTEEKEELFAILFGQSTTQDVEVDIEELDDERLGKALEYLYNHNAITLDQYSEAKKKNGEVRGETRKQIGAMFSSSFLNGAKRNVVEAWERLSTKAKNAIIKNLWKDYLVDSSKRLVGDLQQAVLLRDRVKDYYPDLAKGTTFEQRQEIYEAYLSNYEMSFGEKSESGTIGDHYTPSQIFLANLLDESSKDINATLDVIYTHLIGESANLFGTEITAKGKEEAISTVASTYLEDKKARSLRFHLEGKRVASEQAKEIVRLMEENAEEVRDLELTEENWVSEFGEDGVVQTPLGEVKMGENQFEKMKAKGRTRQLGLVSQTLQSPDLIIEETSNNEDNNAERKSTYVFVKTFVQNGKKVKFFISLSVKQGNLEVVVSNHYASRNSIQKKLGNGRVLYAKETLLPNSSELHLTENQNGLSDLLPTQGSSVSDSKGTKKAVVRELSDRLMKNGLAKEVIIDEQAFNEELKKNGQDVTELENQGTIYGFVTSDGRVFLNPRALNVETPIHEFAHLWNTLMQKNDPTYWNEGAKLIKATVYYDRVNTNPAYAHLSEEEKADEALALMIGDKGASLVEKYGVNGASLIVWLRGYWHKIRQALGLGKMDIDVFVNSSLNDLLNGKVGTEKSSVPSIRKNSATHYAEEEKAIIETAKAKGTYLKAPNGKDTKLSPRQWVQVRTKAFKEWFGDWEKSARIEKLKASEPVEITGREYEGKYELNRDSAKQFMKDNLRGTYENKDTGEKIEIRKDGVQKVTSHSMGNIAHLKSLIAIPDLIENAVFITEKANEKGNGKYDSYRYYVVGLRINNEDYTVKITVGVKGASKYYDHSLTEIEKGTLISNIGALSTTLDAKENALNDFTTTEGETISSFVNSKDTKHSLTQKEKGTLIDSLNGLSDSVDTNESTLSEVKDTKLLDILRTNSSKVVDENGEPLVVYHQTEEQFNTFDLDKARASSDVQGFFFSNGTEDWADMGNSEMAVFLNLRTPSHKPLLDMSQNEAGKKARTEMLERGNDGAIEEEEGMETEYLVLNANQIKSATDNVGSFDSTNDDIRFFIGNKSREKYETLIRKHNPRMSEESLQEALAFLHSLEDNKQNTKLIKVAVKWLSTDSIRLPFAINNVRKAIQLAEQYKVDPMSFKSPMEIINKYYVDMEYGDKVDLDKEPTLMDKRVIGTGENAVVVYDVADTEEGQNAVARICHNAFGWSNQFENSKQPWCLAGFTRQGEPTESARRFWKDTYNSVGKKIAFDLEGNPIAFMAHDKEYGDDLWWNLNDEPSNNLPLAKEGNPTGEYLMPNGQVTEDRVEKSEEVDLEPYYERAVANVVEEMDDSDFYDIALEMYRARHYQGVYFHNTNYMLDEAESELYEKTQELLAENEGVIETIKEEEKDRIYERFADRILEEYEEGEVDTAEAFTSEEFAELREEAEDEIIEEVLQDPTAFDYMDEYVSETEDDALREVLSKEEFSVRSQETLFEDYLQWENGDEYEYYRDAVESEQRAIYEEDGGSFYDGGPEFHYRMTEEEKAVNDKFNEELEKFERGELSNDFDLGKPSEVLRSVGVRNWDIRLKRKVLQKHLVKHGLEVSDIKDLVLAIQNPLMVYEWGTKAKSTIVITKMSLQDGRKVTIAIKVNSRSEITDINEIASVHGKSAEYFLEELLNAKEGGLKEALKYVSDKKEVLNWLGIAPPKGVSSLTNQGHSSVAKIIEEFENPTLEEGTDYLADRTSEEKVSENSTAYDVAFDRAGVEQVVANTLEKVGLQGKTKVRVITRSQAPKKARKSKGFYNARTGEVCIILENARSEADVTETILHEVVGHKGLRAVFNEEQLNEVLDGVFESMSEEQKETLRTLYPEVSDRTLAEEYISSIAENYVVPTFLRKVAGTIRTLLRKMGLKVKWNDKDIVFMLYRGNSAMRKQGMPIDKALEEQAREKVAEKNLEDAMLSDEELLLRASEEEIELADRAYGIQQEMQGKYVSSTSKNLLKRKKEHIMNGRMYAIWIDSTAPIIDYMNRVAKRYGGVKDYLNMDWAYNQMSSKASALGDSMGKEYNKMMKVARKFKKRYKLSDRQLSFIILSKHAKERNAEMRRRKIAEEEELAQLEGRAVDTDKIKKIEEEDYAGENALNEEMYALFENHRLLHNVSSIDELLERMEECGVKDKRLWKHINKVNNRILFEWYKGGMMNTKNYHKVRDMYSHYVPMRGWEQEDKQLEDYMWSPPMQTAEGRSSIPDNVFLNMEKMLKTTATLVAYNQAKQTIYNFSMHYRNDQIVPATAWYVYDKEEKGFVVATPYENESLDDFEERMLLEEERGNAHRKVEQQVKRRDKSPENTIIVYINGEARMLYVNNNKELAYAINRTYEKQIREEMEHHAILRFVCSTKNVIAYNLTGRNVLFGFKNLCKDFFTANQNVFAMWGWGHYAYSKYWLKSLVFLFNPFYKGKTRAMYEEFVKGGGITGFSQMLSEVEARKNISAELNTSVWGSVKRGGKKFYYDGYLKAIEQMENTARFAAYMYAREQGESVQSSVNKAKDITVNFNRRGNGASMLYQHMNAYFFFMNANLQASTKRVKTMKEHTGRGLYSFYLLPIFSGFLNAYIMSALSGGDDDDNYKYLNSWTKGHNVILPDGWRLPLPPEIAPLHNIGVQLFEYGQGNVSGEDLALDVIDGLLNTTYTTGVDLSPNLIAKGLSQLGEGEDSRAGYIARRGFMPWWVQMYDDREYNVTFTGGKIDNTNKFNADKPAWTRANKNTPESFVEASRLMNQFFVGEKQNNDKSWALDGLTNPSKNFHLLKSINPMLAKGIAVADALIQGKEDYPYFVSTGYRYNTEGAKEKWFSQQYYSRRKKVRGVLNDIKEMTEKADHPEKWETPNYLDGLEEELEEKAKSIGVTTEQAYLMIDVLKDIDDGLSEIRTWENFLQHDDNPIVQKILEESDIDELKEQYTDVRMVLYNEGIKLLKDPQGFYDEVYE